MKKHFQISSFFCEPLLKPLRLNATFFVFMYVLGVLCSVFTLPKSGKDGLYDNLFPELFLDLYCCCVVLALIPEKIRIWVKRILYVVLYVVALADVYCFVNFDTTINPSILMLIGETDAREAGDFITSLVSFNVILSKVGLLLLFILLHAAWAFMQHRGYKLNVKLPPVAGAVVGVLLLASAILSVHNKVAMTQLMTCSTIGEVEHTLTRADHGQMYLPIYRLAFSVYSNELAKRQLTSLKEATRHIKVNGCSYRSPEIVLIIGESYGRVHSQQYGYFMPTTPRQIALQRSGLLVPFSDVVSCWNLTSFVFKNVFSMHVEGQKGEWCDYPLFPSVFRKAGYKVMFLTNQFLPEAKQAVFDFSGGFFLNDPELSKTEFDVRNKQLYTYDDGLLHCYDSVKTQRGAHNLIIFHLLGQHVNYKDRYPASQAHFWASDYEQRRPELSLRQRKILSQYDNAVLYNDSIVDQIVKRFKNENAIVIYMPDHGEECFEGNRGFICRQHSMAIDYDLARYEFAVPFWIYCSPKYAHLHPDVFKAISMARNRRFMTDALPHMLLSLAGIRTPYYHAEYDLLSPKYNQNRQRILKNTTDYDVLKKEHLKKVIQTKAYAE